MPFNVGDTSTGSLAIKLEIDILKDENYQEICVTGLDENVAANIESWFDTCSGGFENSAVTGLAIEYSAAAILKYGTAIVELARKRYDVEAMNNVPFRMTNTLLNQVVNTKVAIQGFNIMGQAGELVKTEFTMKPSFGIPEVADLPGI